MMTLNRYLSVATAFAKLHGNNNITTLIIDQTNFYLNFKRTPGFVHDWMKVNRVTYGKYRLPLDIPEFTLPEEISTDYCSNIRVQLNKVNNNKFGTVVFMNNEQRKVDSTLATKVLTILDRLKPEKRLEIQYFCLQSYSNLLKIANLV